MRYTMGKPISVLVAHLPSKGDGHKRDRGVNDEPPNWRLYLGIENEPQGWTGIGACVSVYADSALEACGVVLNWKHSDYDPDAFTDDEMRTYPLGYNDVITIDGIEEEED